MNCRNDSTVQCSGAAADKWKRKRKRKWKDDKCRREVDEERENEKDYKKKVLEEEREFRYDDVQSRRRGEFECSDFYEVSHRWHDDDFGQFHEREKFEKKRERKLREDEGEEDRWINFFSLFDVYINRF